jgi:hypothetical protein
LRKEIAVSSVKLDAVKAGLFEVFYYASEAIDNPIDLILVIA